MLEVDESLSDFTSSPPFDCFLGIADGGGLTDFPLAEAAYALTAAEVSVEDDDEEAAFDEDDDVV